MSALKRVFESLPDQAGCYIVRVRGDRVLYVGQSTNMRRRWVKDGHTYKAFIEKHFPEARFETVLCEPCDLLATENRLIKELKPLLNGNRVFAVEKEFGLVKEEGGPTLPKRTSWNIFVDMRSKKR